MLTPLRFPRTGTLARMSQISYEPGFGAYQIWEDEKVTFPGNSHSVCSFEDLSAISKPTPTPGMRQTPVEKRSA